MTWFRLHLIIIYVNDDDDNNASVKVPGGMPINWNTELLRKKCPILIASLKLTHKYLIKPSISLNPFDRPKSDPKQSRNRRVVH